MRDEACVTVMGPCYACSRPTFGNPKYVPSYEGEMVCADCMVEVNRARKKAGIPEIVVDPRAYEPLDEDELGDD